MLEHKTEQVLANAAAEAADAVQAKPKRKYSKKLKGVQQLERGVSKATHRLVNSVEEGLRVWRKGTEKSARKLKDGAIVDSLNNYAKALSKGLRVATYVPQDFVEAMPKMNMRNFIARIFSPFFK